ncbi:hypothetical protein TMES_10190 [Thalassospira mesophila]|uniref:TIGR02444 family protein n=2 Tax=Thalassospira mesophila TaxID=1293891 RepID=A0A1Y2L097_9PROT|nr:hypothetical protein TMES_10190 [Thalassospira mesophila]
MDAKALWKFTVAFYGRPGVAPVCLDLQEKCGLDVNLLLFLAWLGLQEKAPHSISALEAAVRDWRENVILPLRTLRRHMRENPRDTVQSLRDQIKKDELAAERIEQELLCEAVETIPAGHDKTAPLRAYLSPTRFNLDQDECNDALKTLIGHLARVEI